MSNNILVTGASGFVGSHLVRELTRNKENNFVISAIRDNKSNRWTKDALIHSIKVQLDLNSPDALTKLQRILSYYDINKIYHLASQAIVSRARKNPIDTYSTNIMGTAKLLEAARLIGVKSILHMSTDKVYGEGLLADRRDYGLHSEPYGSSKLCAEWIVEDYRREFKMNITVARPCNIIGYDRYNLTRIVPAFITKLMACEKPIIYDTKSVRQYIYVEDAIKMLQQSMGIGRTINLGSPYILTPLTMVKEICKIMGKEDQYKVIPAKFSEIKQQSMDYDHEFKYTSITEALKQTIEMFKLYKWW